ncbi:hypothetical protein E1176_07450 [Fulvivirga sp. RKSG066]|uniref:hypothetical protein n=1 Tax=Fulvivirga aurantia TaxID=2529383 RepID=UPI0012BC833D|nr:hypothetical protein [Fulvivirga aurantia]MTI20851.1 hypothetical protein [Fulvivirga aurantia]
MKTILKLLTNKNWLFAIAFSGLFLASCDNEEDIGLVSDEAETEAISEADIDAVYEDVDDMALVSLQAADNSGGRITEDTPDSDRFCGTVTFEGDKSAGKITIDFGDGCEDKKGNVRKGKVIIEYQKGRLIPGSFVMISLEGYSINDIAIEGVRKLENISESIEDYPTFHITLVGGKITWPDGTDATREVDKVRVWVNAANPINDEHHVTGTANGKTRRGVNYDMVITDTLVYKRSCRFSRRARIPVAGTKVITTDNKTIIMDFGDGECDRKVEITVNGNNEEVTLD